MVYVKKQKGESEDSLIARFRKEVVNSGLLITYRDNARFKSKSERRKERKYRLKHENELEKKRAG